MLLFYYFVKAHLALVVSSLMR